MEGAIRFNFTIQFDKLSKSVESEEVASSAEIDLTPLSWPPLVFVLGDTTYASCCQDGIGALHLSADLIVHYGHRSLMYKETSAQVSLGYIVLIFYHYLLYDIYICTVLLDEPVDTLDPDLS